MLRKSSTVLLIAILPALGCGDRISESPAWEGLPDWTGPTHGNAVPPDFEAVFPEDTVQRLDLLIEPADWQAMLDDMTERYGPFGQGGDPPPPDGDNPVWVPCALFREGIEWYHVGLRFKGNESLASTWCMGVLKLALKLEFDHFEDDWPEIEDQRFYGFKQLSLSNGFEDPSLMREHLASGIFREASVPVAHTVPCRVFIDHGEGPLYFGLYTLMEVVDDTLIETQFTGGGNLYKPEGYGASFGEELFNELYFERVAGAGDWSDVQSVFAALHDETRRDDPEAWRAGLESVFDVRGFIRWLAVNTLIQNWNSYGREARNYYLYGDPSSGGLTWIPWDLDQSLKPGDGVLAPALDLSDVDDDWPLIRFFADDPVYWDLYLDELGAAIHGAFAPSRMLPIYEETYALIAPYVTGEEGA